MRSLRYILAGRPQNLDDCLDLVRKARPLRVSLDLSADELVTEMFIRKEFVGEYSWEFLAGRCRCRDCYGGFFLHEPEPQRRSKTRRADERLERRLRELQEIGVEVLGADRRFERSFPAA